MHCLYFLCERKFHSRTHVKITRHWKSTLKVLKMAWTIYERNSCARGEGGGGGDQQIFIWGGSAPRLNPLSPFMYHFLRKRDPFPVDKWYPFHIPCLRLELCIPFNYCKCTVFHSRNQSQKKNVFWTLQSHKFIC